jgi:hypothetical protein
MLDFQITQAPMRLGLAEGVEPHQVPFGTLTKAENMCWTKSGLLEHRLGSQAIGQSITGGGSISSGARLFTRGNELALTDGTSLYALIGSAWTSRGAIPNIGVTWETMTVGLNTVRAADLAVAGTTLTEAWITGEQTSDNSNQLYYRVTDTTSGALITPPTRIAISTFKPRDHVRVITDGTNTWIVTAWNDAKVYVTTVGGSPVSVATTAPGAGSTVALDAIIAGSEIVIAFTKGAGGIGLLRVTATTTPALVSSGAVVGEASTEVSTISLCGTSGEPVFVAWATTNDGSGTDRVRYYCFDIIAFATVLIVTDLYVTGGVYPLQAVTVTSARYAASQALLCYHVAAQDIGASFLYSKVVDSVGTIGNALADRTFGVLSRPANIGTRWLVAAANYPGEAGVAYTTGTTLPASDTLVLDVTPDATRASLGLTQVQEGKIECLTGAFWAPGYFANVSSGYLATPFADAAPYGANGMVPKVVAGTRRTKLTASGGPDMWRSLSLGNECVFAAGMLSAYDGELARGYGFATGPLVSTLFTSNAAGAGGIAAGNYLYNVSAERRSASGLLYRSPVGITKVVAAGAASTTTLGVVASRLDHSQTNPGAFLGFRSVVSGSIVQRIALPPKKMTILMTATGSTMTDNESDSSAGLSIRPALYTEGGELEDMQPPSALTLAYHQNRIWLIAGDGRTLWFSKDRTVNPEIAPGFNPSLTLSFDRTLTALAPLDDKLIVFAANTFWAVLGQGPAPTGLNGSYEVVDVQTDVGCVNARSVVSTPDGIMFQSARGIYLLTRALELQWIGRPVKDELATYSTISSGVLVASRNEVRFTAGDGSTSVVLVYNYVEQQWTTSKYTVGGVYGAPIADACLWQGRWTAVTTTGIVFYETTADAWDTDASAVKTWAPETIETAWISATGPLAYQSVRKFSFEGVAKSAHSLTIEVGFDSDSAYPQTKTFAVSAGAETFDISIGTRRKCRSIRFRITGAAPAGDGGTGEGLSIAMLGIEVGLKRGFAKKSSTKTG